VALGASDYNDMGFAALPGEVKLRPGIGNT